MLSLICKPLAYQIATCVGIQIYFVQCVDWFQQQNMIFSTQLQTVFCYNISISIQYMYVKVCDIIYKFVFHHHPHLPHVKLSQYDRLLIYSSVIFCWCCCNILFYFDISLDMFIYYLAYCINLAAIFRLTWYFHCYLSIFNINLNK